VVHPCTLPGGCDKLAQRKRRVLARRLPFVARMMLRTLLSASVSVSVAGAGCGKRGDDADDRPPPRPAFPDAAPRTVPTPPGASIAWRDGILGKDYTLPHLPYGSGGAMIDGDKLRIRFDKENPNVRAVNVGGEPLVDGERLIDAGALLGALPVATAFAATDGDAPMTVDPDVAIEVELHDGAKVTTEVPVLPVQRANLHVFLREALVAGRGVVFGPAPTAARPSIVYWWPTLAVVGPAKTLGEVDWIALREELPHAASTRTCGGFPRIGRPIPLRRTQAKIVVTDVRSGARVAEQTIVAADKCGAIAYVDPADKQLYTESHVDEKQVVAWLKTLKR
jgi:hypothetical protein